MNVLLIQLDGKIPNIALMRIASHHRERGDSIDFRWAGSIEGARRHLWDAPDVVYASAIFERTASRVREVLREFPGAIVGGSGWDEKITVESVGVTTKRQDYSIYGAKWTQSIGFTQRGCRFKCSFCKVPRMEGAVKEENTVADIWRGEPYPRHLLLLDNDFFGQPHWRDRIEEIRVGGFKVSFNQGINARMLNDETAAAIASIDYRDDSMKVKRIYTAWDNRGHERPLLEGIEALVRHGVKPDHIMVYMLIGYDHATKSARQELTADDFYRHERLREYGVRPYPMPFVRNDATRGFQRWIVGAYDKRVAWSEWERAGYEPRRLQAEAMGQ